MSQFTLYGDTKEDAPQLYPGCKAAAVGAGIRAFLSEMEHQGLKEIQHGEFGADMQLSLVNEGPAPSSWIPMNGSKRIEVSFLCRHFMFPVRHRCIPTVTF